MNRILCAAAMVLAGCSTPTSDTCTPACATGYVCTAGTCVPSGNGPDMAMGDAGGGACQPACGGLLPKCNASGHCVGCLSDGDCPNGKFCDIKSDTMATCAIGCTTDDRCGGGKCCNMRCVDVNSDPANCGTCGKACAGAHAQAACVGGQCAQGACDTGWGDCDGNAGNGCETNLHVDANNCAACGQQCAIKNAVNACADGCYIAACNFGFDDCNQDPKDGCEQSVLTDPNNCGGCGQSCGALPNATASCTNGNCVLGKCTAGFADCNKNPQDGCESSLATDPMNCGACGNVCPQNTPFCSMNACTAVNPIKCSMAALTWCQQKGWSVPAMGQATGGRLYCTNNVGIGSDCNQCGDYNMIVWIDAAKPAFCQNFNYSTKAGRVYAGHNPCQCGDNLIDCGTWPMLNCIPD